jgi:hypothetical protein
MNLDAGRNSLYKSFKSLGQRWQDVQLVWHDVVQKDFSEKHWEPLEPCVGGVLAAVDRLSQVLARVHEECS